MNYKLLNILDDLRENPNKEGWLEFLEEMKEEKVLSPIRGGKPSETSEEDDNIYLDLILLEDSNKKSFYIALTSSEEYEALINEGEQYIEISFIEFVDLALESENVHGLVINPLNHGIVLDRRSLKIIRDEYFLDRDKVLIGQPDITPNRLISNLSSLFKIKRDINRAYLTYMDNKGRESFLIVLDSDIDIHHFIADIKRNIPKELKDIGIDMLSSRTELGKMIVDSTKPFYERN